MSNVYFLCRQEAGHKFSLAKPEEIEGNWDWKDKVHCPYCGTADIQLDPGMIPGSGAVKSKTDLSQLRRENRESTRQAQQMAAEAARNEALNNPEVTLAPIQGAGKFGGNVKIKKSILDSIAAKEPGITPE